VLDAVLAQYPQPDKKRLGWWGWSWGGTFTLYALSHSDRFRAGVAVAPVTDWRDYDSIYTERYMSQPAEFGLRIPRLLRGQFGSCSQGHLLLAQGTGDDNVHMENMVQYVQTLIEAGNPTTCKFIRGKTIRLPARMCGCICTTVSWPFEEYLKPPVAE